MGYSIFTALDGILLGAGERSFSDRTLQTLTELQANGHRIFLNTSRCFSALPIDVFRGFRFDGYLCAYSMISCGGKILSADRFSPDFSEPLVMHFYGRNLPVTLEGEDAVYLVYADSVPDPTLRPVVLNDAREIFYVCETQPIGKITCYAPLGEEDIAFASQFADVICSDSVTEFAQFGHSKGSAMRHVIRELNLNPDETVAIGDSVRDLSAFSEAKVSVAGPNASTAVRAAARYSFCEEGDVMRFLKEFLL